MIQTPLSLTEFEQCRGRGKGWHSDVCTAISVLWRYAFGIHVEDPYEVLKVIYGSSPKALVLGRISERELDVFQSFAKFVKSKKSELQRFAETVDHVILSAAGGADYTFGNETAVTIRPPHTIQVDNVSCEELLPFYVGERVRPPSILPSWIKGYLREVLHKLIFVKLLRLCLNNSLIGRCVLYVSLVARDEEGLIIELGSRGRVFNVFNLVGALLGSGGFASPLRIVQREEPRQGANGAWRYVFSVDVAAAELSKTLVKAVLSDVGGAIDALIPNLDIVAAHLIKSAMLIRAPQPLCERFEFAVFVPFAPRFGNILFNDRALECYREFAEGVKVELRGGDLNALQSSLNALNAVLKKYALYLFNALTSAPQHLELLLQYLNTSEH